MCGVLFVQDSSQKPDYHRLVVDAILGSYALQHRGQDGFGMAYSPVQNGRTTVVEKHLGLLSGTLTDAKRDELAKKSLYRLLIHLRYSTTGDAENLLNYQPHSIDTPCDGTIVCCANGDFPNFERLKKTLESKGVDFKSDNDGEFMLRSIWYIRDSEKLSWRDAIRKFISTVPGAYAAVIMTKNETFAFRDLHGFRPLVFGKKNDCVMFASETCALDIAGYTFLEEVERGQIIEISRDGSHSYFSAPDTACARCAKCIFEDVYFSRPDSRVVDNRLAYQDMTEIGSFRAKLGRQVSIEHPVQADICVSLPRSGDLAWQGYHAQSGMKSAIIFVANSYIPRTFIMSTQSLREYMIMLKFMLMRSPIKKYPRLVVVDDSIVRGSTQRGVSEILHEAGAKEIHLGITFPEIKYPCFMGIAMKNKSELIAANMSVPEIVRYLNVNSVGYLSLAGLGQTLEKIGDSIDNYCTACVTGEYPIPLDETNAL